MQKCIGASKAIISNTHRHLSDGMKAADADGGRIHNPLFWPGFTWCVWMSGLILLYAAAEGHYSTEVAQREADRCVAILENLSVRGNFWPGACAAAVKELQLSLDGKIASSPAPTVGAGGTASIDSEMRRQNATRRLTGSSTALLSQQGERQRLRNRLEESGPTSRSNGSAIQDDESRSFASHPSVSRPPMDQSPNSTASSTLPQFPDTTSHSRQHAPISNPSNNSQFPTSTAPSYASFANPNQNFNMWSDTQMISDSFDDIFQLMDVSYLMNEGVGDGAGAMAGWEFGMGGIGTGGMSGTHTPHRNNGNQPRGPSDGI